MHSLTFHQYTQTARDPHSLYRCSLCVGRHSLRKDLPGDHYAKDTGSMPASQQWVRDSPSLGKHQAGQSHSACWPLPGEINALFALFHSPSLTPDHFCFFPLIPSWPWPAPWTEMITCSPLLPYSSVMWTGLCLLHLGLEGLFLLFYWNIVHVQCYVNFWITT